MKVNDIVLLFGKYEAVLLERHNDEVQVYCIEFDAIEPYIITHIDNIAPIDNFECSGLVS